MTDKDSNPPKVSSASSPVTPDCLVTESHVQAALQADKGATAHLAGWKVVDFTKKGDNYACVVTSVEVKYELEGESSEVVYVVKINSGRSIGSDDNAIHTFFEKEAQFYSNIVPQINSILREIGHHEMNLPKYFYASLEEEKEVIFLEDLRHKGYKMADRRQGLGKAHGILVVKELAKLHAASFILQNKTKDNLREKYPHLNTSLFHLMKENEEVINVIKDNVKVSQEVMKVIGGYEKVFAYIDTILPKLLDIFSLMEYGEPKVVCHGDCWINNLLFRYSETGDPEEVMLLDLQIANLGVPANDLNYFLFTSMSEGVRKHNTQAFLSSYYQTFKRLVEDSGQEMPFTSHQLLEDYKSKNIIGFTFAMMSLPIVLLEDQDAVDSSEMDEKDLIETMKKIRKKAMSSLDRNPLVKSRFLSVFDDMIESGIISRQGN